MGASGLLQCCHKQPEIGKSCSWLKHQLYAGKADCPQRAASFLLPSSLHIGLHILATGGEVKVASQTQGSLKGLATKPMRPRALTRFRTGCHQSAVHDNVRLQAMLQAAKKLLGFGPLASIGPGFHQDAVGDSNRLQMLLNAEQQMQCFTEWLTV